MQLASSARIPDGFMAAMRLGGEKPHQGLPGRNPALYQGPTVCNSTTALGLQAAAVLNRIGSCSTGKERDDESKNDYFEARYYSSSMGRFMSPDWSAKEDPVPYAKLDDPQTLNLYSYVQNNPLTRVDADGHVAGVDDAVVVGAVVVVAAASVIAAYESTPAGQRNIQNLANTASENFSSNMHALKDTVSGWFSKKDAPAPAATPAATGPKAATAPGVTAGGQATDEHGNKVGPSGKNQVDQVDKGSKKGAKEAARNAGQGAPEKHPSPTKGDPHYHPTDADGNKKPNSTHYNY
jgi:RHS repeat-associated protein